MGANHLSRQLVKAKKSNETKKKKRLRDQIQAARVQRLKADIREVASEG